MLQPLFWPILQCSFFFTAAITTSKIVSDAVRSIIYAATAIPPIILALLLSRLDSFLINGLVLALAIIELLRLFKLLDADIQSLITRPYYKILPFLGVLRRIRFEKYIFPHILHASLNIMVLEFMEMTALHATLSFFGLNPLGMDKSLGGLIAMGRGFINSAPWLFFGPIFLLFLFLLTLNLMGMGIKRLAPSTLR